MKNKLLARIFICFLAVLMLLPSFSSLAESEDRAQKLLDCKVKEFNCVNVQGFVDGYLADFAGIISEWYVIALAQYGQYGEYDFSKYESALLKYLDENKVTSASTKQKYALSLLAIDSKNDYITKTLDETVGEQGIMSYVFGLHLLNNGQSSSKFTKEEVANKLLTLECEGGGWSLTGKNADVDVTAMVIQALAPYYKDNADVQAAVERGFSILSQKQLEDGDYTSYGVANPESGAQVVIALCALGIDPLSDQRFIKNGKTLFDGIEKYRLESGSYCHKLGLGVNEPATSQVFLAYVAYQRLLNCKGSVFILDKKEQTEVPVTPETSVTTAPQTETVPKTEKPTVETVPVTEKLENSKNESKTPYKSIATVVILALCLVICIVLLALKKASFKNIVAVLIAGALLIVFVLTTNFQSAKDYYSKDTPKKENAVGVVKMSIRCDKIVGLSDRNYIPNDGIILEETEFEIEAGDTVYDILIQAAKENGIQMENNGSDKMAYISGINYVYEMDFGDLSGWVYRVNGSSVSVGCSEYELKDGDVIVWHYSLELGNDIE